LISSWSKPPFNPH